MMGDRSPVRLHYVEEGPASGAGRPPLLLVGSLGSALDMWDPQVPPFAGDRRVIRVDHRGHGESPVPAGPYSIAELAGDIVALLDSLELDQVDYAGLSLGGMIGQYLASEYPERIRRLALLATTSHFPDPQVWIDRIAVVSEGGTGSTAEGTVERWYTPAWAQANPKWVERTKEMIRDTSDVGYLGCCQAIRDWDHTHRLEAITAPTLVIAGTADPSTPPDPHGDTLAEHIPDVRYEKVQAAHLLSIEQAGEVNDLLTKHFAAS
ncbi:MAG TPA: 3-oxoadipate enol-lactonase [Pseudonocardia sp.]|jgi:3-oxoadipate enol-lactonase|nr:3-oxoadipate enol-lactonase [Pseudonocardia sp.]